MVWGTYNHQQGDLTKLLNPKIKCPECPVDGGGEGEGGRGVCVRNRYLGNAQINLKTISGVLPLRTFFLKLLRGAFTRFCRQIHQSAKIEVRGGEVMPGF